MPDLPPTSSIEQRVILSEGEAAVEGSAVRLFPTIVIHHLTISKERPHALSIMETS
jgi:hypothetical protein